MDWRGLKEHVKPASILSVCVILVSVTVQLSLSSPRHYSTTHSLSLTAYVHSGRELDVWSTTDLFPVGGDPSLPHFGRLCHLNVS